MGLILLGIPLMQSSLAKKQNRSVSEPFKPELRYITSLLFRLNYIYILTLNQSKDSASLRLKQPETDADGLLSDQMWSLLHTDANERTLQRRCLKLHGWWGS